jgi:ATP-dependent Lon protease
MLSMSLDSPNERTVDYKNRIQNAHLPQDLALKLFTMVDSAALHVSSNSYTQADAIYQYIETVLALPWNDLSYDNLDISHAETILEQEHYGLTEIKNRILEYLAVLQLQTQKANVTGNDQNTHAPILCFVGLVGTGKTTLAQSIAKTLGRAFVRIPFGGMGSALDLRGQSRVHPEAVPGLVAKAMIRAKTKNPVLLLDEIDRVSEMARGDIMGVLVELLDAEQNSAFTDYYIDYPFDLSKTIFIATANNTKNIATAVLDRLEVLHMPSYSDEEKITIAKTYMWPKELMQSGLSAEKVVIDDDVWPDIVRPLGFDGGMRSLQRTVRGMCLKLARKAVSAPTESFHLSKDTYKEYMPSDI